MKTLPENLWSLAADCAARDKTRIMRFDGDRAFLICSTSRERLGWIWPLLQNRCPHLQVCPRSHSPYGHAFSSDLWPYLMELSAHLNEQWMDNFWKNRGEMSGRDARQFHNLSYLQAVLKASRGWNALPDLQSPWNYIRPSIPENTSAGFFWLSPESKQIPAATWLAGWEATRKTPVTGVKVVKPKVAPSVVVNPLEVELIRQRAEYLAGPRDQYGVRQSRGSGLRHVPVEQLFGNDNGRLGKRERG